MQIDRDTAFKRLDEYSKKLAGSIRAGAALLVSERMSMPVYLVGGALRDAILDRPFADLDLAVPEKAMEFGKEVADETGSTFVPLDPEHGSARVVFDSGNGIDITDFRRSTLAEDLLARDLTCNSLAALLEDYLESGSKALEAPEGALDDLLKGIIRPISEENLTDDPLRMIRAFRYAATLNFLITPDTLKMIRKNAKLLIGVAGERIFTEFKHIFRSGNSASVLPAMLGADTLSVLFPFFNLKELSAWVGRVSYIEKAIAKNPNLPGLEAGRTDMLNFMVVTILAASMPGTRITDLILALRLGRRITGRVMKVGMALVSVKRLVYDHPIETDFLYISARIALSLREDRLAPWLILAAEEDEKRIFTLLEKSEKMIREKVIPVADSPPLVTGTELSEALDRAPGPWISEALDRIFYRRLTGKVTDKTSALEFIKKIAGQGEL